jgi:hypothetical protein
MTTMLAELLSSISATRRILKVAASFTDMAGYSHPHSYLRLANGHVLATFQHAHHGNGEGQMANTDMGNLGATGGRVEIDDQGNVIRSANSADPAFQEALLTPLQSARPPRTGSSRVDQLLHALRGYFSLPDVSGVASLRSQVAQDGVVRHR